MINFMRDTFDEWLCLLAQSYGADFQDGSRFKRYEENSEGILVFLEGKNGAETIQTKYLVDGTDIRPVIEIYERLMTRLVKQTSENQQRGILSFQNNEDLQELLDKGVMKMGLNMVFQSSLNKIRSAEKHVMIP